MTSSFAAAPSLDATGTAFAGDVTADGDRVSQVGGKAGPGKREIDANGLLVTREDGRDDGARILGSGSPGGPLLTCPLDKRLTRSLQTVKSIAFERKTYNAE